MVCFRGFAQRGKGCGLAAAWRCPQGVLLFLRRKRARLSFRWEMPRGRFWKEGIKRRFCFGGYKTKADYDFQAAGDTVLCTVTLPVEGTLQGGRGELLSAEQKTELESIFSASIKEEVEHTIKTALSEGVDFLGILPRAERALPQLAKACTREQLWERMAFRVVPKVQITDMGRKR